MSWIIKFIDDVIGDRTLSPTQKAILKSVYGDPLTDEELELFRAMSGLKQ